MEPSGPIGSAGFRGCQLRIGRGLDSAAASGCSGAKAGQIR